MVSALVYGLGLLLAMLAAAVWTGLSPTHRWIRSAPDAWAAALLPAAVVGDAARWSGTSWAQESEMALVGVAAVLGAVGVVAVAIRDRGGSRPVAGIALALSAGVVFIAALGLAGASDLPSLRILFGPGPYDGDVDASILIHSDNPGPRDLEVLQARLDHLGISADVEGGGGDAVVHLRGVSEVEMVLRAFLPRRAVSLRSVVEDGHDEPVDVVLEDCAQDPCRPVALGVARIDAGTIAGASIRMNEYSVAPMVTVDFTPEGTSIFGQWTTAMVGKRIAVVLDERVVSMPMVQEPITGGSAKIDLGYGSEEPFAEASALAAALLQAPLQGHWTAR